MVEFTATDGVRIHYEMIGSGRPLLLLHGLMANRDFWQPQAPLTASFRLIAPDLRGHGRSPASLETLTVDRLARDMEELAEALDLQDAIVVGWSLGAAVAWKLLTGDESARFSGSVVVDMTPRISNGDDWQLGLSPDLIEARAAAFRGDFAAFAATAGEAILAPPPGGKAALADWAGREFARNDPAAMGALWRSLAGTDQRDLLPQVRCPSLIVRGAHSYLYGPETARYLERSLPRARIVEFAGSGHAPQLEEPELFNSEIRYFAAQLATVREVSTLA